MEDKKFREVSKGKKEMLEDFYGRQFNKLEELGNGRNNYDKSKMN